MATGKAFNGKRCAGNSHVRLTLVVAMLAQGVLFAGETGRNGFELPYTRPACDWFEALPIGNGRLGAMVFGGVKEDCLQLNEDTIWTGRPLERNGGPYSPETIRKSRELLLQGKIVEGNAVLAGKFSRTSSYQPFGDLVVNHAVSDDVISDYRRVLSLDDAIVRTSFACGGTRFVREAFASFTDGVVIYRVTADVSGAVSFGASVRSPREVSCEVEGGEIVVRGVTDGGALKYEGRVAVRVKGGTAKAADGKIVVSGADEATLYVAIATNYRSFRDLSGNPSERCRAALDKAFAVPYAKARAAHVSFYRAQADRCTFTLGGDAHPGMPINERLAANDGKGDDLYIYALLFRYGRYLLISSSQPGTQAANLQGIWNKDMSPAWRSNYTININTQMNYWPTEVTGLGDLAEPLWRLCDELAVTGGELARDAYGAEGWTTHHNADLWRWPHMTASARYGMWPTGGTWIAMHIWYHWLYTLDRDFLARHYATLKGAADFLVSFMVRDPATGRLTVCPSISPENIAKIYKKHNAAVMPSNAIDHELARDMLEAVAQATEILGGDRAYAERLRRTAADVEPLHIGRWGQLQEWRQDLDDPNDHFGHTSHLYALYPSEQITPETPKLFEAAKVSLAARGLGSQWSLAWRVCLWARCGDAARAYAPLKRLTTVAANADASMRRFSSYSRLGSLYNNLFHVSHSRGPVFQIDGNLGLVAGIAEMLMQSHRGAIDLLPALPAEWPDGEVKGLRARGGFSVDIAWKSGRLIKTKVTSDLGLPCKLRYNGKTVEPQIGKGKSIELELNHFIKTSN